MVNVDESNTFRVFILPPELGDGASRSLVKRDELAGLDLFNILEEWIDGAADGQEISIGWRTVSEGELEYLETAAGGGALLTGRSLASAGGGS